MQIGRVSQGFGLSRLWHDPDYDIAQPPNYHLRVQRAFDQQLPVQEHFIPDVPVDPFLLQEKSFDQAFSQMIRGQEGRDFLHGTRHIEAFSVAVEAQVMLAAKPGRPPGRTESPGERAVEATRDAAPPAPGVRSAGATRTAADVERDRAAEQLRGSNAVNEALGLVVGGVAMGAMAAVQGQVLEQMAGSAVSGPAALNQMTASAAAAAGQANRAHEEMEVTGSEQARRRREAESFTRALDVDAAGHTALRRILAEEDPDQEPED